MPHGKIVFALILSATLIAQARADERTLDGPSVYVGLGGATQFLEDNDISGGGVDTASEFDLGWAAVVTAGHRFSNRLRTELEVGYRSNDVDSLSGTTDSRGAAHALTVMGNVLVDFPEIVQIRPYVGLGIGMAHIGVDDTSPVGGSTLDDTDTVPAFQGIVGATYPLTDRLEVFGDYRYFEAIDPEFKLDSDVNVEGDYDAHSVMFGLRWHFGQPWRPRRPQAEPEPIPMPVFQPAPPMPPPPPPEPMPMVEPAPEPEPMVEPAPPPAAEAPLLPRTYLVFFEWDKWNLTSEALEIVGTAATNAGKVPVSRIETTGHADRSGPDRYNMALSKRRAEAVKAELLRQGLKEDEIFIMWKGEREPLVPTVDGVREPQNRRVEIIFN